MWISDDTLDALQTLEEKYTNAEAFATAFSDTAIGADTLAALYAAFYWRTVCDNDRFEPYLRSVFSRFGQQYNDLLRVQLTRIDPMVTKYLERELKHNGKDVKNTAGSVTYGGVDRTDYGKIDAHIHGEAITTTRGTSEKLEHGETITNRGTDTDTTDYGHKITTNGQDNRTTTRRQSETATRTDTIAARHTGTTGKSSGAGVSDSRSLQASLPRVDSYSSAGINAPGVVTLPDGSTASGMIAGGLDWRNADSQAETVGANNTTGETSGSTDTTVDGDDVSKTVTEYAGDGDTDNLNRDMTDTHSGQDKRTLATDDVEIHAGADTRSYSGSDKVAHSGTDENRTTGSDAVSHTGTDTNLGSETTNYGGYDRERYTGRDGSPAELLQKAREYISGTGAFSWLCRHVDTCFIDLYDY